MTAGQRLFKIGKFGVYEEVKPPYPAADPVDTPISNFPTFPHCDSAVLHAPSECEYCDRHPEWQHLRMSWGIAFTGHDPTGDQLPDPASVRRPVEIINRWPGNRPKDA